MTDGTEISTKARVRFAPSPTGTLHLGGLRTALFSWLQARHTGGEFILRIEDTDQNRYDPESLESVLQGLRWLGLDWDEGPDIGGPYVPYVQSERKEMYQKYAEQLLASGQAYRCYATAEELAEMREEQRKNKQPIGYDRRHRYLTDEQRASFEAEGRISVVRFAAPIEGSTTFHDLIRGDITTDNRQLQDMVLLKGDGMPTYHLAVVVDDHHMQITHILRGQEWLGTAPIHKLLFDAFDWKIPTLVHLPVILDPSGKGKMSKRKKVVAGKEYLALVHEFIEAGYLPEAMFNFLTNIGWSFDAEQEVFSRADAIERFNLETINPSAAALPYDKLDWLNGLYIREMSHDALKEQLLPYLSASLQIDIETLQASQKLDMLVPIIQERLKRLTDGAELVDWAFKNADEISYSEPKLLIGRKLDAAQSVQILEIGASLVERLPDFTAEALEEAFREKSTEMELKVGSFFAPFRAAVTGKKVSPPLFESMVVLGREETLLRIQNATKALQTYADTLA